MSDHFDLLVIGGGSGGIATAKRAAKHGARVALIESDRLGGTCVNIGCVPKKIMWQAAQLAEQFGEATGYGFSVDGLTHDWATLVQRREAFIRRLNGLYGDGLDSHGVTLIRGRARMTGPKSVDVEGRTITAEHVLIAVGGRPVRPPVQGAELGIDSDGFFALEQRPRRVAVIGAGYIAVELAGALRGLGAEVSLVYRRGSVLRSFDAMLGETLLEAMAHHGVNLVSHATVARVRADGDARVVEFEHDRSPLTVDAVLWAVGRQPATDGLGLDAAGVETDARGHITVDAWQNTNVDGVYAVGDITGQVELTPVAIAAGRRLADRVFGGQAERRLDYNTIPSVVFSHPPIGTVGVSEAEARAEHGDDAVRVYTSGFRALYYGVLDDKFTSRFKLVCVGDDERVVGCHMIGPGADEILQGFAVAIRMGATKADLDDTVAIHPTSAEELVTMT